MSKELKAVFVYIFLNYFMPCAMVVVFTISIVQEIYPWYVGLLFFLTPIVMSILSALCIESILES